MFQWGSKCYFKFGHSPFEVNGFVGQYALSFKESSLGSPQKKRFDDFLSNVCLVYRGFNESDDFISHKREKYPHYNPKEPWFLIHCSSSTSIAIRADSHGAWTSNVSVMEYLWSKIQKNKLVKACCHLKNILLVQTQSFQSLSFRKYIPSFPPCPWFTKWPIRKDVFQSPG